MKQKHLDKRDGSQVLLGSFAHLLLILLLFGVSGQGQQPQPLTKERIVQYLKGDVSPERVATLVRERGIDFDVTAEVELELRAVLREVGKAASSDSLVIALRTAGKYRSATSPPQQRKAITNIDVFKMVKAKLSEDAILRVIERTQCDFDVKPDALIEAKAQGVSDRIISAMQNCQEGSLQPTDSTPNTRSLSGSALRGVGVRNVTFDDVEAKRRFGLEDIELLKDKHYTLVDHIDENSDAAIAGVHVGDYITVIILGGKGPAKPRDETEFQQLATRCQPDCLIGVKHVEDLPWRSKGGYLPVGQMGTNFELSHDSLGWLAYKDKITNLPYSGLIGTNVFKIEVEEIRNASHGLMPSAIPSGKMVGGKTSLTVVNTSANDLDFICSGPVALKASIASQGSETLALVPGQYEIATKGGFSVQFGIDRYFADTAYRLVYPQSALRGLDVDDITKKIQKELGMKQAFGVLVKGVEENSPANAAGIQPGDVIFAVRTGDDVNNELSGPEDFHRLAAECAPDCLVSVTERRANGHRNRGYVGIGSLGTNFVPIFGYCSRRVIGYVSKNAHKYDGDDVGGDEKDSEAMLLSSLTRDLSKAGGFVTKNTSCTQR